MSPEARLPNSSRSNSSKKHHFRFGKPRKSPAPAPDSEQAPLLEDTPNQDVEANRTYQLEESPSSWPQRLLCWAQGAVVWLLENLVIVVLACLLAAGTVFVCVYGGELIRRVLILILTEPSCTPSWTVFTPAAIAHMRDSRLRSCRIRTTT